MVGWGAGVSALGSQCHRGRSPIWVPSAASMEAAFSQGSTCWPWVRAAGLWEGGSWFPHSWPGPYIFIFAMDPVGKGSASKTVEVGRTSWYLEFLTWHLAWYKGSPGGSVVKNPAAKQETGVWSLDWEDPLEKEVATHSGILYWEIPRTEEPGGLQSMGSQRVRQDLVTKQQQQAWYKTCS